MKSDSLFDKLYTFVSLLVMMPNLRSATFCSEWSSQGYTDSDTRGETLTYKRLLLGTVLIEMSAGFDMR